MSRCEEARDGVQGAGMWLRTGKSLHGGTEMNEKAGQQIRIRSIVPVSLGTITEQELARKCRWGSGGTIVEAVALPAGAPTFLDNDTDIAYAAPFLVDAVKRAERDGVSAVILDCFADPAIEACRCATRVPIVGCGQAAILTALSIGMSIGIVVPNEVAASIARRAVSRLDINPSRYDTCPVLPQAGNPYDDLGKTKAKLKECCQAAGANHDVVVIGCTGLERLWEEIQGTVEVSVPVIRPFPCAVKLAELLVSIGVSHSPRTYPMKGDR